MKIIQSARPAQLGFSLIELMIAVAIVGILAAIAYPSYTRYQLKANRSTGMDCLVEAQRRIEDIYVRTNFYPSDLNDSRLGYGSTTPSCGDKGQYQLSLTVKPTVAIPKMQIIATGQGAQAADGTLRLTYDGTQVNPNVRYVKDHITPSGTVVTTGGWSFQPGQ